MGIINPILISTINKVSKLDRHPLPKVDDMFAALGGGCIFSKIDMSEAYAQVELDETSRKYTTINSHMGLYQYKRIPNGNKSAPSIFQKCIESVVAGIPNDLVFLDDKIITGKTPVEHQQNLYVVLGWLEKAGLKLGVNKCQFYINSVTFLGHKRSHKGIEPLPEKLQAILEMLKPTNITEVQAYPGHVKFYRKFLPNLSKILEPIHHLLRKEVCFQWDGGQSKRLLSLK